MGSMGQTNSSEPTFRIGIIKCSSMFWIELEEGGMLLVHMTFNTILIIIERCLVCIDKTVQCQHCTRHVFFISVDQNF